jgi:hypothetical protein
MRDKAVTGQKFMRILGNYTNKLDFEPSLQTGCVVGMLKC